MYISFGRTKANCCLRWETSWEAPSGFSCPDQKVTGGSADHRQWYHDWLSDTSKLWRLGWLLGQVSRTWPIRLGISMNFSRHVTRWSSGYIHDHPCIWNQFQSLGPFFIGFWENVQETPMIGEKMGVKTMHSCRLSPYPIHWLRISAP